MAIIEILSTQFAFTSGITLDSLGNIYVTDTNQKNIRKISADTNEVTVLLSGLDYPSDIILDDKNNIYFIDRYTIKKISADTQEISTIATITNAGSLDIDNSGNIYVGTTSSVVKIDSSTSLITTLARGFNSIYDIALDNFGNLYVADTHDNMIKKISLDTLSVSTILSTGLNHPTGIDIDLEGNVYISDNSNGLIKKIIVDTNTVEILHYKMTSQYIAVDSSNNIYFSGNNTSIYKMAPNNLPTSSDVTLTIDSDIIKVFKKSDFSFTDLDNTDTLSKIQITSLPTLGTLKLNGVAVTLNQEITSADLNLSKLTYQTDTNAKGQNYTSFDYKVFDGFSYADSSSTLTFDITAVNDTPIVSQPLKNLLVVEVGKELNYSIPTNTFIDVDGDVLTYTITVADGTGVPPWISFNSSTKTFTGTPTVDDVGSLNIKVLVTDPSGASTSDTFNLYTYENSAPSITSDSIGTVAENSLVSTVIYTANATDSETNTINDLYYYMGLYSDMSKLTYSLSGTDASLLNIDSSTGNVTLKSPANYEAKNKYSFNVIASDGTLSSSKAVTVNVTNINEFNPTSVNKTITIKEDISKVLTLSDFVFKDADANSTLSKVKITQLETKGSLKLNGVDVTLNKEILASDIKANKLVLTPISNEFGTSYSNFKFQVSDGTKYSTSSYTTTFNVTQVIDTVSKSTTYTLPSLIENLTLTGTSAINGTGNTLNNTIIGNSANNVLDGKTGADTLKGGLGNDTYVVDNVKDVVTELASQGTDTIKSSVTYTLSSNVENLTLSGTIAINGIGNALNNVITGNSNNNVLNGGAGIDTLSYSNATKGVKVLLATTAQQDTIGAGKDTISNFENLTGSSYADTLTGNSVANTLNGLAGNDILNGGAGADKMLGGSGNDTYYVDNEKDVVTEKVNEGIDKVNSTVTYALSSDVENLTLLGTKVINGTGNNLNNIITGNVANNVIDGGLGIDTLKGGLGNDTYVVDNVKDVVTELASQGTDTIKSSVTYTLSSNVENLTLIGSSAINGNGNTLNNTITGNSAANTLNGLAGNDTLNGGAGADKMLGSSGNDTYYVDNIGDKVYETKTTVSTSGDAGGIDKVNSSISYTLTSYVENLTLTGTKAINGTGNNLNNTLIGNAVANKLSGAAGNDILNGGAGNDVINGGAGNDVINGGLGNDTLIGGLGKDTFVFNTAMNSTTNVDKIKDFSVVDDLINLENSIFTKLTTIGTLKTANFKANIDGLAKDVNDYLVYETDTGKLFYDADGSGVGKAVQIALIENKAALTYADFTVI